MMSSSVKEPDTCFLQYSKNSISVIICYFVNYNLGAQISNLLSLVVILFVFMAFASLAISVADPTTGCLPVQY